MGLSEHLAQLGFPYRAAQDRHLPAPGQPHVSTTPSSRFSRATSRRRRFRSAPSGSTQDQIPCHLTYTNARTHEIIRGGIDRSPMYSGRDSEPRAALLPVGRGQGDALSRQGAASDFPRTRGARHRSRSIPTGFRPACRSTCSSRWCGRSKGWSSAEIMRPGYAIEYDFSDPTQLQPSLETKLVERAVLRRPNQRHHRLRRSGGAGTDGGNQCRVADSRRSRR